MRNLLGVSCVQAIEHEEFTWCIVCTGYRT